jgi:hypothetical protein
MPFNPLVSAIVSAVMSSVGNVSDPTPTLPGMGIIRALPAEAKKGEMMPPAEGRVQIDGKSYSLSPSAQIRNELNMIIMPGMVQSPVQVRYLIDTFGSVNQVWILSAAEVELPDNR